MAKLSCPKGCRKGWSHAVGQVSQGVAIQVSTCGGCGYRVESRVGVARGYSRR